MQHSHPTSLSIVHSALCIAVEFAALCAASSTAFADTWYVATTGSGGNPGTEAAPFASIADALSAAQDGDEILVAPGTYAASATINVNKGVTVSGASRFNTVVEASGTGFRLFSVNHADAVVRGLTIRGATCSSGGAGVLIGASGGTVEDCRITGNTCTSKGNAGGGVHFQSAGATLRRCRIDSNATQGYGGGVFLGSGGRVETSLVTGNSADYGGGIYVNQGGTSCLVANCTVAGNSASHDARDAYFYQGAYTVLNAIVETATIRGTPTMRSSAINSGGSGYVSAAGLFDTTLEDDYRPAAGSAAIRGGTADAAAPALDIDGLPYPSTPDIGCYTSGADALALAVVCEKSAAEGEPFTLTPSATGISQTASCRWRFRSVKTGAVTEVTADALEPFAFTPAANGYFEVELTVTDGANVYHVRYEPAFAVAIMHNYVSKTGSNLPPYETWETAANDIGAAVNAAMPGATVHVADGTYEVSSQIEVTKPLTLKGENGRDHVTVTAASGASTRLIYVNNAAAVICGITFSGGRGTDKSGQTYYGGAASIDSNGGTIEDCRITGSANRQGYGGGAGMLAGTFRRTIFDGNSNNNSFGSWGGALYIAGSGATVDTCLFYGNSSANWGGAIYADGSGTGISILCCTIADNTAPSGGADVCFWGPAMTVKNCLIGHSAVGGGTVGRIIKADNLSLDTFGTQIDSFGFVDAANGDYGPDPSSPAVNAGALPEDVSGTDLFGLVRPQGAAAEIGAVEREESVFACNFNANGLLVFTGAGTVTFTPSVASAPGTVECAWTFSRSDGLTVVTNTTGVAPLEYEFSTPGVWSVALTATSGGATASAERRDLVRACVAKTFVSTAGSGTVPYNTPEKATTNFLAALALVTDGGEVAVAAGRYILHEEAKLTEAVTVRGAGKNATVLALSEGMVSRVMRLENVRAVLEGVTVTGGLLQEGYVVAGADKRAGAGVLINSQGGTVRECRIVGNTCGAGLDLYGAGVAIYGANARLSHCEILCNTNVSQGSQCGGGIYMNGGSVDNCLVVRNVAGYGSGLYAELGTTSHYVSDCTIAHNAATKRGGGAYAYHVRTSRFLNTLIFGNTAKVNSPDYCADNNADGTFFVNCLSGNAFAPGGMDAIADARFRNAAAGDFHLRSGSPAVNAGRTDASMWNETDLDGNRRVRGGVVDVGCYEYGADGTAVMVQ